MRKPSDAVLLFPPPAPLPRRGSVEARTEAAFHEENTAAEVGGLLAAAALGGTLVGTLLFWECGVVLAGVVLGVNWWFSRS